jgi:DNA-binding response OmpR family regulator
MKLFIIDWCADDASAMLAHCTASAHKIIGYELRDGGEAYRKTGLDKPDAIIINYATKPLHGRVTAESIRKRKATALIPVYFIDGDEEDNEKVANLGLCLSMEELNDFLHG